MKTLVQQGAIYGCIMAGAGILLLPSSVLAKATGPCVDCHTMHNSQGGAPMNFDGNGTPNDVLLRGGCVSCHTADGTNGGNTGANNIPYVMDTSPADYTNDGLGGNTLAGGSFYWVATAGGNTDSQGHNVTTDSLATADATLGSPPGYNPTGTTIDFSNGMTCAGTTGCHGDRTVDNDFGAINGSHHGDDSLMDGSTNANSYRFLLGVVGLEDSDWEYQPTSTAHNQYYGTDRTDETNDGNAGIQGGTISSLCSQCHTDFHNGTGSIQGSGTTAMANPWIRHPTDYDMGNTAAGSEYRDYGGSGTNSYVVNAPVASSDADQLTTPKSAVTFNDDTIVTCISCHRAHGTPNDDLLRWDYTTIVANGGSNTGGCFECHTTKF